MSNDSRKAANPLRLLAHVLIFSLTRPLMARSVGVMNAKVLLAVVTKRALVQRINRKLQHQSKMLKALRSERGRSDLGDFFVVDVGRNAVIRAHCDLEELGRELGVLGAWERVEQGAPVSPSEPQEPPSPAVPPTSRGTAKTIPQPGSIASMRLKRKPW